MGLLEQIKRPAVLARISGIPVRADYRWFFVVGVMSAITAVSVYQLINDLAGSVLIGLAVTVVFFASIFFHEFAHAAAARLEKLDVVEIILHPFGGLTRFRHPPETPRAEFRIAIAGPAASFLLTLLFTGLMAAASAGGLDILAILLFLLALSNFLIAVFNLFPGYPLDGGRVLRAYLWKNGKDLNEATILTGKFGKLIAGGLIILGLFFILFYQGYFTGFWAVMVGLFLYDSAQSIISEVEASEMRLVEDAMMLPITVDPDTTLQDFVDEILPIHRKTVFLVARDRNLFGMLVLEDVKPVERSQWHKRTIREVMRPVTTEHFVETGTALADATQLVRSNGCGAVGVIDSDGHLVGQLMSSGGKNV